VTRTHRIGLIVPSSNTTIETEVPELLRRLERDDLQFTFHSSRTRLKEVGAAELAGMNAGAERCMIELADAEVDVVVYACLIALVSQGVDYPARVEADLLGIAREHGLEAPVITSARALLEGVRAVGAQRVAVVTPYIPELTDTLIEYLEAEDVEVVDSVSLAVSDNRRVAELDPRRLPEIAAGMDLTNADAVLISACVQMPSLSIIAEAEERLGLPVMSAATATAYEIVRALDIEPRLPGAGSLLAGTGPEASRAGG
jgi:maleate isomerase